LSSIRWNASRLILLWQSHAHWRMTFYWTVFAVPAHSKTSPESDAVQLGLRRMGAPLVQSHAVREAVVSDRKLFEGLALTAARVDQIGGDAGRKGDAPQDVRQVARVGGEIAHLNPPFLRRHK
jgi:hypothetical protein